jgi:hypothetical protein
MDDRRHTRDLMTAYTAIVLVWLVACGLTFASAILFGREESSLDSATALIGDYLSREDASK